MGIGPDTPGRRLYAEWCGSPDCDRVRYYHAMNAGDRKAWEDLAERVGRDRDADGSGARRALPGEGTGMSGVVELAEQLAVAVKALEEIAGGRWNVGAPRNLLAREFAQRALDALRDAA